MVYEIHIFQSTELIDYCDVNHNNKWIAAENVKHVMEEVANNQSFSVDITVKDGYTGIDPPYETAHQSSYTATDPCTNDTVTYGDTRDWWRDQHGCLGYQGSYYPADDSNLLLTNDDGQSGNANTDGFIAHFEGGQDCADANPPSSMDNEWDFTGSDDYSEPWDGLHIALHEMAHNLIPNTHDHHAMGNAIKISTPYGPYYSATPMTGHMTNWDQTKDSNDTNYCNNSVYVQEDDVTALDTRFSSCVDEKI